MKIIDPYSVIPDSISIAFGEGLPDWKIVVERRNGAIHIIESQPLDKEAKE